MTIPGSPVPCTCGFCMAARQQQQQYPFTAGSAGAGGSGGGGGTGGAHYGSSFGQGGGGGGSGGGGGAGSNYSFTPAAKPARRSSSAPRMDGFDGHADFDFAIGMVRGFRWWKLGTPDLSRTWDEWQPGLLTGAQNKAWQDGENVAVCNYYPDHKPPVEVFGNNEMCGCGHWAYWALESHNMGAEMPVAGVVEGWGRTLIGTKGFRCEKARIVALYLPWTLQPAPGFRAWHEAFRNNPHFADKGRVLPLDLPGDEETEQQIAREYCQAWMGVIQDQLMSMYPGAEIFATKKAMLAKYPPVGRPGPHELETG